MNVLYDQGLNARMRDPKFAEFENRVRDLENQANKLAPRVDELTVQVGNLSRNLGFLDSDSPAGRRLAFSLNQARADLKEATESLANIRAQLAEAISERDALLNPKA
jgi:DNA repair ATPase RecN